MADAEKELKPVVKVTPDFSEGLFISGRML